MRNLRGKTVVITGAASGIGRALALKFAKKGSNLALCDRNGRDLDRVSWDVQVLGARVLHQVVDVASLAQVEKFKDAVISQFGAVDVLINNAGVSLSETVLESEIDNIHWILSVNFFGVVHGCKVFLPELLKRKEARIVNLSSVFGLVGLPSQSAYCASKFAVKGYTESLRGELLGSPVKVTLVHPGGVQTNIVRNGRHLYDANGQKTNNTLIADQFESLAMTNPDHAASLIVKAVHQSKFRLLIGPDARLFDVLSRLLPSSVSRIAALIASLGTKKMVPKETDLTSETSVIPQDTLETSVNKGDSQAG
jgi:short-subunit dehydrogenase